MDDDAAVNAQLDRIEAKLATLQVRTAYVTERLEAMVAETEHALEQMRDRLDEQTS